MEQDRERREEAERGKLKEESRDDLTAAVDVVSSHRPPATSRSPPASSFRLRDASFRLRDAFAKSSTREGDRFRRKTAFAMTVGNMIGTGAQPLRTVTAWRVRWVVRKAPWQSPRGGRVLGLTGLPPPPTLSAIAKRRRALLARRVERSTRRRGVHPARISLMRTRSPSPSTRTLATGLYTAMLEADGIRIGVAKFELVR